MTTLKTGCVGTMVCIEAFKTMFVAAIAVPIAVATLSSIVSDLPSDRRISDRCYVNCLGIAVHNVLLIPGITFASFPLGETRVTEFVMAATARQRY